MFVLLNPHPPKKGVWCPSVYKLSKPLGECSNSDCCHGEQWFCWCWFGGWLLGFNLFFMAKGDNSSFHLLYCSSGRNQARFSTRKKILAWPLFCLFFHLPPTEAWLVGSTLPTMKGELPQWGLSYILSPSAAEKPLLEVK